MKKLTALLSLTVLLSSAAFAQEEAQSQAQNEPVKLSIEEAVNYAVEHSRTLKSNDIDLEMKKRASSNSWNVFLPEVSISGTMNRSNEFMPGTGDILANAMSGGTVPLPTDYDKEEDRWATVGTLSASWNFTPAYIAKIKIAKTNYEAGLISWEQSNKETITNIKKIYYGLLLQQESLKIQKASLENARRRMNQAKINFENGSIPKLSYLQTQVSYENARPEVVSSEQALKQQYDLFAFMLGLPIGTDIELTSSIEPQYVKAETQDLLDRYGKNDLKIKSMEKNIDSLKLGITASNLATWLPVVSMNYKWMPAYIGSEGAWHFTGDIGDDDKWYDSGSFSVTLVWNITNMLPWSKNRQDVKDLKQQLVQLELATETLKENQKIQVRKAVDTLNQAKAQIDAMGRNVTLAAEAYEMTYTQYTKGTAELLDLRDAETSLNQARLGLLNQKFQYISALMDLENTLNVTLSEEK